jgi:hypothetical protein
MMLGVNSRMNLVLGIFGVVPDLDAMFLVYRSTSHYLIMLAVAWTPILVYTRIQHSSLWNFGLLGIFVLFSQPLMDMVQSHTLVLWPLYGQSIFLRVALNIVWGSDMAVNRKVEFNTIPTTFSPVTTFDYPIFTGEGLVVSAILLLPVIYSSICGKDLAGGVELED